MVVCASHIRLTRTANWDVFYLMYFSHFFVSEPIFPNIVTLFFEFSRELTGHSVTKPAIIARRWSITIVGFLL